MLYFLITALFYGAGGRDVPKGAYFVPVARGVKGPKSATERSHDGEAKVAAAISGFPAWNFPFLT